MKHNSAAPLRATELEADLINLRAGEKRTICCPDCGTWRLIKNRMIAAHRAEPRSSTTTHRVPRCPGSARKVWIDLTPEQWQTRYERLLARRQDNGVAAHSRHSTRVKHTGTRGERSRSAAAWAAVLPAATATDERRAQHPADTTTAGPDLPLQPLRVSA